MITFGNRIARSWLKDLVHDENEIRKVFNRLLADQDVQFVLIFWYVAKIISTLMVLSLYSSIISLNCFSGDIMLVPVPKVIIYYCKIHF